MQEHFQIYAFALHIRQTLNHERGMRSSSVADDGSVTFLISPRRLSAHRYRTKTVSKAGKVFLFLFRVQALC